MLTFINARINKDFCKDKRIFNNVQEYEDVSSNAFFLRFARKVAKICDLNDIKK